MKKVNGKTLKSNGHSADFKKWLAKPHNKELLEMLTAEDIEEIAKEDLECKKVYDDIDKNIEISKIVIKRLRKRNLLASLRIRELAGDENT